MFLWEETGYGCITVLNASNCVIKYEQSVTQNLIVDNPHSTDEMWNFAYSQLFVLCNYSDNLLEASQKNSEYWARMKHTCCQSSSAINIWHDGDVLMDLLHLCGCIIFIGYVSAMPLYTIYRDYCWRDEHNESITVETWSICLIINFFQSVSSTCRWHMRIRVLY
jgi:hypothetical protein